MKHSVKSFIMATCPAALLAAGLLLKVTAADTKPAADSPSPSPSPSATPATPSPSPSPAKTPDMINITGIRC